MKFVLFTCMISIAMITGCAKNSDTPADPNSNVSYMNGKMDGTNWNTAEITTNVAGPVRTISGTTAANGNGYTVMLALWGTDVGEQTIGFLTTCYITKVTDGKSDQEAANSGTIKITESSSSKIKGTFSAVSDSHTIAEGEFQLLLQ